MSEKLIPNNPEEVMVIREVVPGVTTLSVPFSRFGMIKVGGRATIVKLATGSLAVFSPAALTPTVQTHLKTLSPTGTVRYLIAPDFEHHIFLSAWSSAFPSASVIGPEGLPEKRAELSKKDSQITNIPFSHVFTGKNKRDLKIGEEFDAEFDYEYVEAHQNKELVFFHKPTKTLIEADLMFNLPATEQYSRAPGADATSGFGTRLFGALQNTRGDAKWQKRMLWYALSAGDRGSFNKSVKRIDTWGFENIVPCHGDSIVGGGKGVFQKVFQWHLEAAKKE